MGRESCSAIEIIEEVFVRDLEIHMARTSQLKESAG